MPIKYKLSTLLLAILTSTFCQAQEGSSIFSFLRNTTSAHAVALGGHNVSLAEDNVALTYSNPALMANVSDKTIGLNFLTYMKGVKAGSAGYCQAAGERGTWGANVVFQGYGSFTETLATGEILGTSSALDMCISGGYSYELNDYWSGGATGKVIYSHFGEFSSCALAADLGLNYYDEDHDFSFGIAARNLGAQVKRFGDHSEKLPADLEAGVSFGLGHAPITLHITLIDLTCWKQSDYYSANKEISGGRIFTNHLNLGVDIRPVKFIYISGGYNFRRAYELKAAGASHAAGLTFGAGLNLKKIKCGLAYAKYHLSMPAFSISLAYSL